MSTTTPLPIDDAGVAAAPASVPVLVAALYDEAPPPLRQRLLNHLLGPVGPLALVAVAAGAFARLLPAGRWSSAQVQLDDVWAIQPAQVLDLARYVEQKAPEMLWGGVVFHPFGNNAVEAAFADQRTYVYQGKEVDRQTHLGFDLARVVHSPIVAANRGKVVYAAPLGIYGNCVILDHGMGVQSLYAHLSSIAVQTGQMVDKEQELGKSGMTGMAGGDHLHFTMLVNGHMVNPVEWWDQHWIQDRILRKLKSE